MNKIIFTLFFIFCFVEANSNKIEENKKEILKITKDYAVAVACETTFDNKIKNKTTTKDIVYFGANSFGEEFYYILWGGDIGCEGGTGSSSYYISEVSRYSSNRPFLLKKQNIFDDEIGINFRFIQSFKKISDDSLEIISLDYSNDDANCCPSLKYKYIVKLENEKWSLVQKIDLKKD